MKDSTLSRSFETAKWRHVSKDVISNTFWPRWFYPKCESRMNLAKFCGFNSLFDCLLFCIIYYNVYIYWLCQTMSILISVGPNPCFALCQSRFHWCVFVVLRYLNRGGRVIIHNVSGRICGAQGIHCIVPYSDMLWYSNSIRIHVIVCMCMCICVYVCMHVCMYVCMYVCVYVCMYVCTYVRMYVCMCVYVCMYVMYVCMYVM